MKEKHIYQDCIHQIYRLFSTRLYKNPTLVDEHGFIRMDDWEMKEDVQKEVIKYWDNLKDSNLMEFTDLQGYHKEFLKLFGFGFPAVDYHADTEVDLKIPSLD